MHAHLSTQAPGPDGPQQPLAQCVLRPLTNSPIRRITLWGDEDDARAERERTGDGHVYEVEDVLGQPAPGGVPAAAALTEFDGPRDDAQRAADRRASRERVWPAAAQVPGTFGALVLRAADGGMTVLALADAPQTHEAVSRTIMSTPLLPGEDPTLLRGPDRHTVYLATDCGLAELLADPAVAAHPERTR